MNKDKLCTQCKILQHTDKYFDDLDICHKCLYITDIDRYNTKKILEIIKYIKEYIYNDLHIKKITYTKPGSINYLLFGKQVSMQSYNIKFGIYGQILVKKLIEINPNLKLLDCGIQNINGKKLDVDLIWLNNKDNIIIYLEMKSNIDLDTEKLPATIQKCKIIKEYYKKKYQNYKIIYGIFHWSIYERSDIDIDDKNLIKKIEIIEKSLQVYHFTDFIDLIDIYWKKKDFYQYFSDIGKELTQKYHL